MSIRVDGNVLVEGAEAHPHAFRRLREELPGSVIAAGEGSPERPVRVTLITDPGRPEGSFAITARDGDSPAITIEGGPFSGVIYGIEVLVQRQVSDGAVGTGTVE